MQQAIQLLQEPDKELVEVAHSVGYESDAAFSKDFNESGSHPGRIPAERGVKCCMLS